MRGPLMPDLEDTQPLHVSDLPTEEMDLSELDTGGFEIPHLGWDLDKDGDIEGIEEYVPEPAVLRGAVAAGLGFAGFVLGKTFDVSWIDQAVAIYAVAAPFVLGFVIRRHVTPTKR
ncbi:minor tail protein [Mycobacterium phage Bexan]|uniref:Minor tail protein n=8 Tax=Viruses TaxID=10239 RepID=B5LLN2_9CAUD|nr:minor tail protein [Mycobacterium phage KBG]YP_002223970.1 minor tail protein [Mycobacterium phage Solon]YP_008058887.1 minor tail protein [Mycobacterium phage CASbig]YP_008410808.1 minor tail protein [Mycobacterium phage Wheeler]YP_008531007.1 minor tail protein [Mycobacterium phage PhrostyMug]YP_009012716.1 minor tail protein [Mycobacterium phage Violet]YP_009016296.1 minor tail protein [Mycobacterium phage Aeneas]YP_009031217.1 minor tail protein [Mycobacterium phage Seabiscuit]YP_009